jgi:hypothetical protein
MDDSSKATVVRVLQILIPLASVSVAVVSLLLTVAARKKELTCTLLASTRLVSENLGGINPDLHVEFRGQPITTLSNMSFSLRNTGAAAIKGTDISEPLRIQFPASTRLLSAVVERTSPQRFLFSATTVTESSEVVLTFSLLNAGDEAQFSVYALNSDVQRPMFEGRVVDVSQMQFVDISGASGAPPVSFIRNHAMRTIIRWTLCTLFGVLTAVFVGLWVSSVVSFARYLPWKRKWKRSYDEVVEALRKKERDEMEVHKAALSEAERKLVEQQIPWRDAIRRDDPMGIVSLPGLEDELKKRGIPEYPNPTVESLGGLAGLSVLLLSLTFVCSITGLIIYGAMKG